MIDWSLKLFLTAAQACPSRRCWRSDRFCPRFCKCETARNSFSLCLSAFDHTRGSRQQAVRHNLTSSMSECRSKSMNASIETSRKPVFRHRGSAPSVLQRISPSWLVPVKETRVLCQSRLQLLPPTMNSTSSACGCSGPIFSSYRLPFCTTRNKRAPRWVTRCRIFQARKAKGSP